MNDTHPLTLTDRIVLITGAASGIGLATAKLVHQMGAKVVGVDLQPMPEELDGLVFEHYLVGNVADEAFVQNAVTSTVEQSGRIDDLILAAGINGPMGHTELVQPAEFRNLYQVNVQGVFNFVHFAIPSLTETKGTITLVGSINGSRQFGWGGAMTYISSKAAVMSMGRSLAVELGPREIRVNTVCPGATQTKINESSQWRGSWPVGRPRKYPEGSIPLTGHTFADAEDVANSILFLLSPLAKHVTGTELFVDGGQSLV